MGYISKVPPKDEQAGAPPPAGKAPIQTPPSAAGNAASNDDFKEKAASKLAEHYKEQLEAANKKIVELEQKNSDLEQKVAEKTDLLDEKGDENRKLREDLQAYQIFGDPAKIETTRSQMENELRAGKSKLSENESALKKIEIEVTAARKDKVRLEEYLKTSKSEAERYKNECTELFEKLKPYLLLGAPEEIQKQREHLFKLEEQTHAMGAKIREYELNNTILNSRATALEKDDTSLRKDIESVTEQYKKIIAGLREQLEKYSNLGTPEEIQRLREEQKNRITQLDGQLKGQEEIGYELAKELEKINIEKSKKQQ